MNAGGISSQYPSAPQSRPSFDYSTIEGVRNNPQITPEFLREVEAMAARLQTNPEYLLAMMSFESGLDPSAVNGVSGATGLIQFMPDTARGLGTTTAELRQMSAMQQLQYVERYLEPFAGQLDTVEGVYTAVLSGHPQADPDTVLFAGGTAAYSQNSGLDLNHDGRITTAEATQRVRDQVSVALPEPLRYY